MPKPSLDQNFADESDPDFDPSDHVLPPVGVLKRPAGFLDRHISVLKRPAGVLKRPSVVLKRPIGVLKQPIGVLKRPSGVFHTPSAPMSEEFDCPPSEPAPAPPLKGQFVKVNVTPWRNVININRRSGAFVFAVGMNGATTAQIKQWANSCVHHLEHGDDPADVKKWLDTQKAIAQRSFEWLK